MPTDCDWGINYFIAGSVEAAARDELAINPNLEVMRRDVTFPLYAEINQIYSLACLISALSM